MSFLTPVKVPVKVYLSTDKDAPKLDRTPNCVATILKACLVTGYGDKVGAGWSLAFEDNPKGVKVLKPADSPHTPFMVRLSQDTGREMTVQVYSEMSDIDTGELKLQCDTSFKYGIQNATGGKWAVIACGRAFWFFHETANQAQIDMVGSYLFCGDTAQNTRGERAVYLKHTGGTSWIGYAEFYSILAAGNDHRYGGSTHGKILLSNHNSINADVKSLFDGEIKNHATLLSNAIVIADNEIYGIHAYVPSNTVALNYQELASSGRKFMNHAVATHLPSNFYVPIDYWEF